MITSVPSLVSLSAAILMASAYRLESASPRMSIGLLWLQCGGRSWLSRSMASSDIGASSPPLVIRASVARTPGPPALVTMVSRGPSGRGCLLNTSALLKRSEIESTRKTPLRRNAAARASSPPVSEPVCEAAALAASSVRPGLMTMIGLVRATSRAADIKDRALPMVSM